MKELLSPYIGRGTWKNFKLIPLGREGVAKYELGARREKIHETCQNANNVRNIEVGFYSQIYWNRVKISSCIFYIHSCGILDDLTSLITHPHYLIECNGKNYSKFTFNYRRQSIGKYLEKHKYVKLFPEKCTEKIFLQLLRIFVYY